MDTIKDILGRQNRSEPAEIRIIKEYVAEHFQSAAGVSVQEKTIIIQVANAGLAGSLRPHLHRLTTICRTKKRFIIRIG